MLSNERGFSGINKRKNINRAFSVGIGALLPTLVHYSVYIQINTSGSCSRTIIIVNGIIVNKLLPLYC